MNLFPEDNSGKAAFALFEEQRKNLRLNGAVSELAKMKLAALPGASMNPAFQEFLDVQKQLKSAFAPNRAWEAMTGKIPDSLRRMALGDAYRGVSDSLALMDDLTGMRGVKALSQFSGSDYAGKLSIFRDSFFQDESSPAELMKKYAKLAGDAYAGHMNPAIQAFMDAQKNLQNLIPNISEMDDSFFELSDEDEAELKHAAPLVIADKANLEDIKQFVEKATAVIARQESPAIQLYLLAIYRSQIFGWIMGAIISTLMSHYAPSILGGSPQAEKKAVQENARMQFGSPEFLGAYRFVSARELAIRQNPRSRSPSVGSLKFGYTVEVLKKEGDFTLIQWQGKGEQADAQIQGWVFSRYLEKFK
ncbi:SH3 domain-containing protein [Comamonas sp. MYb396]|uniref:SH3 domain-containing protein n=1 Tax=Comamonas sp. MYb396 TaxID=2745302 RepID=UPI0030985331